MKNKDVLPNTEISIIVAYSKNRGIGKNGKIPWKIDEDLKRFKKLTLNNVVIMGRITFLEILNKLKAPLPNRENLIISTTEDFSKYGCPTFAKLTEAIVYSKERFPSKKIFIAGGESLYKQAISIVDKIYATEIDLNVEADRFFPLLNIQEFDIIQEECFNTHVPFRFLTLKRKK